ncbi:MAG: ATP-binding protein [Akkermansiaceae bacterium]|jgi:predicted AAA+ superfamily ATPase|nr:ATP-binding protein [Luteolibacter sp.]
MKGEIKETLQQKLNDALVAEIPHLTRREIRLPAVQDKAHAVIGMRRSGKTCFLSQCMADLLASGAPRESLILINFEDERLSGIDATDLSSLLEMYYQRHPEFRDHTKITLLLDEIQLVPGWETFARRVLDTEKLCLFLSGSSASMLSREVHTSMRGRAMETCVYPFSFREALSHRNLLPNQEWKTLPKSQRSVIQKAFLTYLAEGGFPEAQGIDPRDRRPLLQSYVDVAVLRDIIERHGVSNPMALRWLQRHLLGNPCAPFSIQKFYDVLKSQGLPVSKDSLHAFLGHFEDAFLIHTVSLFSASERQRMVNPRKAYPIDHGLISIYERAGRDNLGHTLESAVYIELRRRSCEVHYFRTKEGSEVDFHAMDLLGKVSLIQVCANADDPTTLHRELRSLIQAKAQIPQAKAQCILLEPLHPNTEIPAGVEIISAIEWFLQE